ncbi:hypothetical protein, partial [Desulfococcus multivorans]
NETAWGVGRILPVPAYENRKLSILFAHANIFNFPLSFLQMQQFLRTHHPDSGFIIPIDRMDTHTAFREIT